MPRINSTAWATWNPVLAARLEDFNEDIDNIYATGSDHFKVYHLSAQPALQVTIGPGTYRVWGIEGQYAGWTLTVGVSVTTYIMINSAWVIQTSTSAWDGQYTRLAVVVSGASIITSITDWRNKVVGGDFGWNPTGAILMWTTNSAPSWYLLCDGTAVSRTTYAGLFALISTTYGVGDWSTTFNIPNMKGRVPVGRDSWQTEFDVLGETWGAKTHTLAETEIPAHVHTIRSAWPSGGSVGAGTLTTSSSYSEGNGYHNRNSENTTWWGLAHNNLQPYLVVNYIIKT